MRLATLAADMQSLLFDYAAALSDLGVTVPLDQYVGAGQVPYDGESLVVNLAKLDKGTPGMPSSRTDPTALTATYFATLYITLLRAVPVIQDGIGGATIPTTTDLAAAGAEAQTDASAMLQAGMALWAADEFATAGGLVVVVGLSTVGPDGGLAGSRLEINLQVE